MSQLKVNQTKNKLLAMFQPHLDLKDIPLTDKEREQKTLTRCLAALAVYLESGCSEKEAAAVFGRLDDTKLSAPIESFGNKTLPSLGIEAACVDVCGKMVAAIQAQYANKFLAVLFKNPTMSKQVYDMSA